MTFTKLLHLLQKDALLVRRSKLWTTFEVLLPVFLIACPAILFYLISGSGEIIEEKPIVFNDTTVFENVTFPYCDVMKNETFHDYLDGSPIEWKDNTIVINGGKMHRKDIIKDARKCGKAFIVEANMSSTIITSELGGDKNYEFVNYNYLWNKRIFEMFLTFQEEIFEAKTMIKRPKTNKNQKFGLFPIPYGKNSFFQTILKSVFPVFFGCCMMMPVISVTRNILVETESVKPYLSTIGLPVWLFYIEHFLVGVIKTTILITLSSLLWVICFSEFSILIVAGIFCYTLNSIAFAVFFSTIFPSPKRVVEGMSIIWISTIAFSYFRYPATPTANWFFSLIPTYAFKNFLVAILTATHYEGLSLSALFHAKFEDEQPVVVYVGYMIFNTIWMLVSAIFMNKIIAFLTHVILKQIWGILGNRKGKSSSIRTQEVEERSTILNVQEKLDGRGKAAADIELNGLVKVYGNGEKAVNGLSLRAIRGQVSILLGHNGCGKSTTFGMITGMHKPTEGKIIIGGIDANSNRSEARKLIGYCSQYNPLYDKLTVMEHLRLVNALKGGSRSGFRDEAEDLLEQIELTDKKDTLAKNLSGGMKRKLCVCMAMIGNSRVILLDEPTAGMDSAARIDVQKMLALVKTDRTILLTTHYMDEAEKLGDWVFVMSHGKMAASGSIHYLKQKYGGGMLLTLVFKTSSDPKKSYEAAIQVCKAVCPSATVKDERGQMMEISISETEKSSLPRLFKILEDILELNYSSSDIRRLELEVQEEARKLELVTIGVSMSSLEQVFIKIGDECDAVICKSRGTDVKTERRKRFEGLIECKNEPVRRGLSKTWATVRALLEKRAYYLYRNMIQILLQVILPLAILWAFARAFSPARVAILFNKDLVIESLNISSLPKSIVAAQVEDDTDTRLLDYLYSFPNLNVMEVDYKLDIQEVVEKYSMGFRKLEFVIQVSKEGKTNIYYDTFHWEKESKTGILMNLLASCMYLMTDLIPELPRISSNVYWLASLEIDQVNMASLNATVIVLAMLTIILAGVIIQSIVYLIEERICKFAHQQYLTGLSTITYWAVVFLWDFILFTIIIVYYMSFVRYFGAFVEYELEVVVVLYCFLFHLAPVVYLTAILVKSPTKGSLILYMLTFVSLLFFVAVISAWGYNMVVKWVLRFLGPITAFFIPFLKLIGLANPYTGITIFLTDKKTLEEPEGIWIDVFFILINSLILTLILFCLTSKSLRSIFFSITQKESEQKDRHEYSDIELCEAVEEEEEMVSKMDKDDKVLIIDGLIKDFGKFRAVNGLSVSVGNEECFGMLGANGAGKTTTFDIITGLTMPTGGNVYINGEDIKNTHIGYCPQFDAMLPQISCRQTLRIMARLQGYPNVSEVVETVLECVGMKEHGYKLVKNCSGGQKRKISVGIALMSRANCIILDEPTAGIDPRARREIWDIIHEMREQGKCSIVLTSHSMEECEALCNRIGILRKGEMIALGTSQTLKSQYGNTYMMTLILHNMNDRTTVSQKVEQLMPGAVLKTPESSLTTTFVWEIPKTKADKWSLKYQEVAVLASTVNAKDYMLTQASLEDIFIRLITTEEKINNGRRNKKEVTRMEIPKKESTTDGSVLKDVPEEEEEDNSES